MFTDQMRPTTFDEMIGNVALKAVLQGQMKSQTVAHTILLVGNPGTGKTTTARILADYLNAQVLEVNCGADTGIDKIREIIDSQALSPLMGDSRLYILDEVHALTKQAQQALLKPAEEPSATTYFILCTTDPAKVDPALRTRCLELSTQDLSEIDSGELVRAVTNLMRKMPDFKFEKKSDLNVVVDAAGTSYRNLYNALEKLYSAARIVVTSTGNDRVVSSELVRSILGNDNETRKANNDMLAKYYLNRDLIGAMDLIKELEKASLNPYSTFLGVYRYIKAVYLKRGVDANTQSVLAEMALALAEYKLTWQHIEYFTLKLCRK